MTVHKQMAILCLVFNVLDATFTSIAVAHFGPRCEMNPIMRATMVLGGLGLFWAVKLVLSSGSVLITYRAGLRHVFGVWALHVSTFLYAGIVGWSLYQFWVV